MLIVRLTPAENGARPNQLIFPDLASPPEGWVQIPPALEAQALELLPWLSLELSGGTVVAVGDNAEARSAALAAG